MRSRTGCNHAAAWLAALERIQTTPGIWCSCHAAAHTTFNARTYLQPQLNKAVAFAGRYTNINVDRNPKDFVLFTPKDLELVDTGRDNTGDRTYTEDMMFPTLRFPSDHGVTAATLRLGHRRL